jgi:hypothetical protein
VNRKLTLNSAFFLTTITSRIRKHFRHFLERPNTLGSLALFIPNGGVFSLQLRDKLLALKLEKNECFLVLKKSKNNLPGTHVHRDYVNKQSQMCTAIKHFSEKYLSIGRNETLVLPFKTSRERWQF